MFTGEFTNPKQLSRKHFLFKAKKMIRHLPDYFIKINNEPINSTEGGWSLFSVAQKPLNIQQLNDLKYCKYQVDNEKAENKINGIRSVEEGITCNDYKKHKHF